MKIKILRNSIIASSLTQILLATPTIEGDNPTVCPQELKPMPIKAEEVSTAKPNDYSVSLLTYKHVDMCKGAIIAPSWVLTAKHCATTKLNFVTDAKRNKKIEIKKKIRFKGADIALLQLNKPEYTQKKIITLSAIPLLNEYGKITYKKVIHNASRGTPAIYKNLELRAKSKKRLKSLTPKGKAGSSGSPWVVETSAGDILVGVTHGGGEAPQVSSAKKWIDSNIKENTPKEKATWLNNEAILLSNQ